MNFKAFLFMFSLSCVSGYKILLLWPQPIRSINILGVGYVRHLLNAGHEITHVSSYPLKNKPKANYTHVDLSATNLNIVEEHDSLNISYLMRQPINEEAEIEYLQAAYGFEMAEATFQNKEMQKLLNDPNAKFDLVITDLIESEIYTAVAAYFDCPMIHAFSLGTHWPTLQLVDEVTNPAYAFDYLSSDIPPFHSMSLRLKKLWKQIQWHYYKRFKTLPREHEVYRKHFAPLFSKINKPLPDYNELIYSASFVLSNDFVGHGPITSVPQNFKFIGGYHIETPAKPLPDELKSVLDKAEHGFIYMSMGSIWRSKDMPEEILKELIYLFESLKETVIWKYEDVLPNLPKNVHIIPWAPQQSILAHPKCLFFISHGGLLSTLESVHYGVPTIGVPLYFDQFINVNRAVQLGRTIKVDLTLNLIDELRVAIKKMIHDPTYKQRAIEVSEIYHDRPVPPGAELVHWVEHVIKTRGAPHLRSPASLMPWWEKLFLDIIVLTLAVLLLFVYLSKKYLYYRRKNSHKKID